MEGERRWMPTLFFFIEVLRFFVRVEGKSGKVGDVEKGKRRKEKGTR